MVTLSGIIAAMPSLRSSASVHATGAPEYELHTLGWHAFQDLCATVLREVWGQSVQSFADSNDGGRDGAFYGRWRDTTEAVELPEGPLVLQCKFIARRDTTLTLSVIDGELAKVRRLVDRGLCKSYVLMSNARVTGESEAAIREALSGQGVEHPLVLAGNWLNQAIAMNQRLRMYVPRVYGLGDLSKILDERAYAQARALLDYLQEDLSTFVVTNAYRQAAKAVEDHGFCLLLGEPAVGKSVIAATLAMTAVDSWQSLTVKVDGPGDIVTHWDPHEPNQFFWADDAFGPIRHDRAMTDDWARRLPKVMAAIKGGAKVVLTSRDYIYRDARRLLKEYAYPLLHERQVVIDVADLSQSERRQIVYNHVRLGDQPKEFRTAIKSRLADAADQEPFRPEVARRIGSQSFTRRLKTTPAAIREFMAKPNEFLHDIFGGLEADHIGALAMVYQAGELSAPLGRPTPDRVDLLALIGSTYSRMADALSVMDGTFLRCAPKPGSGDLQAYWAFRHPTLREGFARFMAANPSWLEIFLQGLSDDAILGQLDCGSGDVRGTLVKIPPSLYVAVAERVLRARPARPYTEGQYFRWKSWANFLADKCSREFIEVYLSLDPELITRCMSFGVEMSSSSELRILAKLHTEGLLSEGHREKVLNKIREYAVGIPDAGWLTDFDIRKLMTYEERELVLAHVKEELIGDLEWMLRNWYSNEQGESAEDYYLPLEDALTAYTDAFLGDEDALVALREAQAKVVQRRADADYWIRREQERTEEEGISPPPMPGGSVGGASGATASFVTDRDMFDDVDE
jgi:hypothetical protein